MHLYSIESYFLPTDYRPRRAAQWALAWLWLTASIVGAAEGDWFVDRSHDWGLDFVHFNGMSGELYFSEMVGSGVALFDYDLDGDLDVYAVQGHMLGEGTSIESAIFQPRYPLPLSDRLYRNDQPEPGEVTGSLRFVDVTESSGIASLGYGMGVAVGDIDNDGDPDIYITNAGPNQMLRNNGDGSFSDVTDDTGTGDRGWGVSAAFVDYDRDGQLDLYVGNYVGYRMATDKPCSTKTGLRDYCGPLAYEPQLDRLYRNRGDGRFADATAAAGISEDLPGGALGVATSDFNRDGWPDIYVANDQVPNKLWMNQQDGTFLNDAVLAGCAVSGEGYPEASMGLVVGDFDGDGSDDLFMSHLARETNTLYLNDGTGMFIDVSRDSGLGIASWQYTGFGLALFDYDLDGWLDVFVANGAVNIIEELARRDDPHPLHQKNQLYRGLGGGQFEDVSAAAGAFFELSEVSRGVAVGDLDNDGDPDLLVTNNAGAIRVLENRAVADPSWLGVDLRAGDSGLTENGARLTVAAADGRARWRRFARDGSYASSHDSRALVGLGEQSIVENLQVSWPDGTVQVLRSPQSMTFVNLWR